MRLTDEQVQIIHQVARQQLGDTVQVTLFGSRVFDDKKGGDIDLFFETENGKGSIFDQSIVENPTRRIIKRSSIK